MLSRWGLRESYSLRAHLIAFSAVTLLPVTVLAAVLLARSAALEREQLETRLVQVASNLADVLDHDIDRQITILQTLAKLPSLAKGDWPTFYEAAKGAVGNKSYVILIDTSHRQVVNTFVAYGKAPPTTGDPETVRRILSISNAFSGDHLLSQVALGSASTTRASKSGNTRPIQPVRHPVSAHRSVLAVAASESLTGHLPNLLEAFSEDLLSEEVIHIRQVTCGR